jgi:hypothetical protein
MGVLKVKIGTVGTSVIVDNFIEAAKLTGEAEITAGRSALCDKPFVFAESELLERSWLARKRRLFLIRGDTMTPCADIAAE